ncbi:MAG TPA: methyltransferase domain-containing protein [Sumerlaeia bacterium]|nr:methyltransferase domain-containing protein [Sumerlaeia bacterium]
MTATLYWNPNTLVIPLGKGLIRLFQTSYRRNVVATRPILDLADQMIGGAPEEAVRERFEKAESALRLADASEFTLWECAYSNSDFFDPSFDPDDLQTLEYEEFVELLTDAQILARQWPPVFDLKKRSFGDRFRGTFFEQIGTEGLYRRTQPTAWWTAQKFTEDLSEIKPTPYKFIEEAFLDAYIRENMRNLEVLEIGCGTGFFTRRIAAVAKRAVGMDSNEDYVEKARKAWPSERYPNLEFHVGDIVDLSKGRGVFQGMQFHRIIMIDTFLFLFDPSYQAPLAQRRAEIMRNIAGLLRPDGHLLIMDPHPFWLTPWLGLESRPFGIVTEYRDRSFKVIPTLEEISCFLFENGLRIRRILEPRIDERYANINPKAHAFMKQFPQWWFLETEKAQAR